MAALGRLCIMPHRVPAAARAHASFGPHIRALPLPGRFLPGKTVQRPARAARRPVTSVGKDRAWVKVAEPDRPFLEPFMRSFVLGLSAGVIFEVGHIALKALGLMSQGDGGLTQMPLEHFGPPNFFIDHAAAMGSWLLFYIIEAMAVMSVLNSHPDDAEAAAKALGNLVTLPKTLVPVRLLPLVKRFLAGKKGIVGPALPAASAFVDEGPTMVVPRPRTSGASSSVLTAPLKSPPQEEEEAARPLTPEAADKDLPMAERRRLAGLKPGQIDTDIARFAKRQKELQSRRLYLKNFWYAAALSSEVTEKPLGVEILGQKIVLFRGDDGKVVCISDVCPHRGAPLHMGWVSKVDGHDCVVCPYHGWAFDGEGYLRDVPASEKEGDWPHKPVLPAYDVEEKGGFVYLYYGPKQMPASVRPPIPWVPELENPDWKPVYGSIEFDCGHWSVFENAIDMAHIHYLHNDTFGNQGQPQIRDMVVKEDAYSVTANFRLHNKPVRGWEWSSVPVVEVTAKAMLPSTSVIAFTLGNGLSFTTFVNTVPISANRSINRFALVRNLGSGPLNKAFNMGVWDSMARKAMLRILGEDKAMVEQLRPDLLQREVNVKADRPQTAFRKLRQQWIDLGYGIEPEGSAAVESNLRPDF